MEIPTLFYRKGTCALGAMITAEWTRLPYQLCRLEEADSDSSDYLMLNPHGAVPLMKVGRTLLTQSFAILQHLALQHPHHHQTIDLTYPYGHAQFDRMNEVLAYLVSDFHGSFGPRGNLQDQLNFVNRQLVPRGLIFDQPTIADAYLYATSRWAKDLYDLKSDFPNIAHFHSIMEAMPSVQFALAIEEQKPTKTTGMFLGHLELQAIAEIFQAPTQPAGLQLGNIAAQMEADRARGDGASLA